MLRPFILTLDPNLIPAKACLPQARICFFLRASRSVTQLAYLKSDMASACASPLSISVP